MSEESKRIVVLTGMSGSGKSTAIRALEDAGYFCIDNLPVLLLPRLTELAELSGSATRLGLVIDAREGTMLAEAPRVLADLRREGHQVAVLFLDASDESLQRRFSETRRRHPLAPEGTVEEGLHRERRMLHELRLMADLVIDTSGLTVHELKRDVQARFAEEGKGEPNLTLLSFGYRYGVPPQADLVFDLRFLPNPYFVPELKGLTGLEARVSSYVLQADGAREFLDRVQSLCEFLFPRYQREGKAYVTVGLGCTGGKHRSVALVEELLQRLGGAFPRIRAQHRDIDKE
ncbi:MAG: RNase adapter RapZ [Myxococcaceae bacterium]